MRIHLILSLAKNSRWHIYITNQNVENVGQDSIVVEDGNPIYDSRENCNAIIETKTNTLVIGGNSTIIPNTVKTIGENAFMNCFRYCNMWYSVTIPDGVECIEKHAFSGCYKLSSITIPDRAVLDVKKVFENPAEVTEEEIAEIKEQAKLYHKYYDVIHYGDLYRLESPFENWDRCAWQFVSEDKKEALVTVVQIKKVVHGFKMLKLQGLKPDSIYKDEATGETYSGAYLMNAGLNLIEYLDEDGDSYILHLTEI